MKQHAFYPNGNFYKGNLHTHTTASDGRLDAGEVKRLYKLDGYSFVAFTDHRVYSYRDELCDDDFITLPGIEVDRTFAPDKCDHFVCIGIPGKNTVPDGARFPHECWQEGTGEEMISYFRARGNFVIYAHPYWSRVDHGDVTRYNDSIVGMEIFNYGCEAENKTGVSEFTYDQLLRHALRENKRLCYAFATDDSHFALNDMGGGYIVVKAPELTRSSIVEAILNGSFYSSSGPEILDFYIEDAVAKVFCSPAQSVYFNSVGYVGVTHSYMSGGEPVTYAQCDVSRVPYIRATVVDSQGRAAWTNALRIVG